MKKTLRIQKGSLTLLLEGDENEDLEKPLRDMLEMVKSAKEDLGGFLDITADIPVQFPKEAAPRAGTDIPAKGLESLAAKAGVPVEKLQHVIHMGDDTPLISVQVPGVSRTERQRNGTVILLTTLHDVYSENTVSSSKTKKLLRESDIEELEFSKAFKRKGKGLVVTRGAGRGATCEVTVRGRKEAYRLLGELVATVED